MTRAAAVAALGLLLAPAGQAAERPLSVHASVAPSSIGVGDPFVARVDVSVAPGIDPDEVRVAIAAGPFTALGPPAVERRDVQGATVVRATQRFACLSIDCVPGARPREIALPSARARLGTDRAAQAFGPRLSLRVVPRVPAAALEPTNPAFRRTTAPPEPRYRITPGLLVGILLAGAGLLGVLAAALVAVEIRRSAPGEADAVDPFARAIRLLRESVGRPSPDRRRAAGLIARLLAERDGSPLADSAGALAWSAAVPDPPAVEALAEDAETVARSRGEGR